MADESEFGPVNLNNVEPDKLAMPDAPTPAATPAVQEPRVRKPFRLNVSKEWCMKMAASEGDTEISAGVPEEVRAAPTTLADALTENEKLHSIYIQACTGRAEFRNALRDARAIIASQAEALAAKEAENEKLAERLGQMTVARDVIADFQKEQSARADAAEAERDQLRISIVDLDRVVDQLDIANTVVDPAEAIAELQTRLATAEAALKAAREALDNIANGQFPGASRHALAGNWHGIVEQLQEMARAAYAVETRGSDA